MRRTLSITLFSVFLFTAVVSAAPSNAKEAMAGAAKDKQYLLLTFYETKDNAFSSFSSSIETLKKSAPQRSAIFYAKINETVNREMATKFGIQGTQDLPILLIIAPNGVVTGGFSKNVKAEEFKRSLSVSDLMLKTLKFLQEQKVVLVALQNKSTKYNTESWKAVSEFVNDKDYKSVTAAFKADPADGDSQEFLTQCSLSNTMTDATVVILLPPGKIGKILTGKTSKEDIVASLQACSSGSSGCCSDRRFKNDITPLASALDKVLQLQGVSFTWNRIAFPHRDFPEGNQIGLIAQDVENVVPEVVTTDFAGYRYVEYDKLTAMLIEAVKELKQQVDDQKKLIVALQARLDAIRETK